MDLQSIIRADVKSNGRKKLILIGKTGSGKSSLCNALCQPVGMRERLFPETSNPEIGNVYTIMTDVNLDGDPYYPISLIDTVGFDSIDDRVSPKANLVHSLKKCCDFINVFGLVINGQSPRMEESLQEMIKIFESMFGKNKFWSNVIIIFSKLEMSQSSITRRMQANKVNDQDYCTRFVNQIKVKFELASSINLPYLILDAHCSYENHEEVFTYMNEVHRLYGYLLQLPDCPVQDIREVLGRYEGLEAEIKRLSREDRNEKLKIILNFVAKVVAVTA